ncbi:MAG: hypothetical protein L6R37_004921 [Teloschistes peruensis]|nr:MAG: hypothetical protein L6R37_004921 [Teloschistes peruensis]
MAPPTLYILYNADASVMGKLSYSYRKLTSRDPDKPACAACDITHGGLHLDETSQWKTAKAEIVGSGAVKEVKQLHRDELDKETKSFVQSQSLRYPMVLAQEEASGLRVLMDDRQLAGFKGNPQTFMQNLRERLAGGEGDVKL